MADVINELDFAIIDNAIEQKKSSPVPIKPIDSYLPEKRAEWDDIPAEQPPKRIDWAAINKPAVIDTSRFDWSNYKPEEDEFITYDDFDVPDLTGDKGYDKFNYESSRYTMGNSTFKYDKEDPWWEDIGKGPVETDMGDLYDMQVELQTRVDKMSSDIDDLTDTVKSQYVTMMKMINAIYKKVNDASIK